MIDGRRLKFEYRPLGDGDVDYLTILRRMRDHGCDVFLSLATHFRPAQRFPHGGHADQLRQSAGDDSQGGGGGLRGLRPLMAAVSVSTE